MGKKSKKIAIIVDNYFEEMEFTILLKTLKSNGNLAAIISPSGKNLKSMKDTQGGKEFEADLSLEEASSEDYDALVLPGGIFNANRLRVNKEAQAWVSEFISSDRLVAACGYAVWLLVSADIVEEMKLTSPPTLKDDVCNAGGEWTNRAVVVEDNLITTRGGSDTGKFADSIVDWLKQ
jgi:protease I